MKRIVETTENQGLESLLNENVLIFCLNYFYAGKLTGVNETCIELTDAEIVYETGDFKTSGFKTSELLPTSPWFVQTTVIESFGRQK